MGESYPVAVPSLEEVFSLWKKSSARYTIVIPNGTYWNEIDSHFRDIKRRRRKERWGCKERTSRIS